MKTIFSILAVLAFALKLSAADTNAPSDSSALKKISSFAATNYYDQTIIVTGKVVQVTVRPTVTFMNMDKSFPNSPFAIVIFHSRSSFYGDANKLKGRDIEIKGKVIKYKDKPEMSLNSMDQLKVIGVTNLEVFLKPKESPTNAAPTTATNLPEVM
jgi:DNA/RNA endonuclease YhcR with UshA esterase domain